MAVQTHDKTVTVTLTDADYELLEIFAAEQGLEHLSDAVPAMIHELLRLHDLVWESQLTTLPASLVTLGQAALEAYEAEQTEDFDTTSP